MKREQPDYAVLEILDQVVNILMATIDERKPPLDLPAVLAAHQGFTNNQKKLFEIREFILAVANGNLSKNLTGTGYLCGALKTLQSHLRHLTWQTQAIASGDYTQRVDFMGEFSEAFNSMVEKLASVVKALHESEERYRQLAITDALTQLFNRGHFYDLARQELARAHRYGHHLTVIMLDIDHFKMVNDTYGHHSGDRVLKTVADVLRRNTRAVDIIARYGGEEFICLLPETDNHEAFPAAERIREAVADASVVTEWRTISVTASLGVNVFLPAAGGANPTPRDELEELIKGADTALYQAKNEGRNCVKVACMLPSL
ncbi:MAG: diguanylate cyclase [Thermodesulfobacteriota bacterium]